MIQETQSPEIEVAAPHCPCGDIYKSDGDCRCGLYTLKPAATDITQDLERLSRELCMFAGHDPDANVFPGTPETMRTSYDRAYIIPPPERLIPAWQLFQPAALAVRDLKARGLLG